VNSYINIMMPNVLLTKGGRTRVNNPDRRSEGGNTGFRDGTGIWGRYLGPTSCFPDSE